MHQKLLGLVVVLILVKEVRAQELSTFVYPSEDELAEAFYNGEIDFIQLVTLQEIIRNGIDSSNAYLLDEIPNLAFFFRLRDRDQLGLTDDQTKSFLNSGVSGGRKRGKITHTFARQLEEAGSSRYRTTGEMGLKQGLKAAFRMHREYSGVERFVYRRVEHSPEKGHLRRLVLGNYTTRLGLGTIIGYRGKLLDFSNEIDGESLLFPDYGGYNGLLVQMKKGKSATEMVFSQLRDHEHSMTTIGGKYGQTYEELKPTVIFGFTKLRNRTNDRTIRDFKYGLNLHSNYNQGNNEFEITGQSGERNSFGAFVTEGEHLFGQGEIDYSLWLYGDDYLDLTGGSKAANIRKAGEIEVVDFNYSDKRSGQEGGLFKTKVELSNNTDLINSLIYAQRGNENYNVEILSAIEKSIELNWTIRIDHVSRFKHRLDSGAETEDIFRRSRIELRIVDPSLYVRTYLAYQSKTDGGDYSSFFANVRYKNIRMGELAVWFNLGEFKHNRGRVNYWYGFLENKNEVMEHLKTIVKLTHSYRRDRTEEHLSTVTVGLELTI